MTNSEIGDVGKSRWPARCEPKFESQDETNRRGFDARRWTTLIEIIGVSESLKKLELGDVNA